MCSRDEIEQILREVKAGVVNPIGTTETFCLSALDYGEQGVPVVCGKYGGLIDVVGSKYGYTTYTNRGLRKTIRKELKSPTKGSKYAEYVRAFLLNLNG